MTSDALRVLVAGSPYIQIVFEVAGRGELVGVVATRVAHRCGLLLVDDVAARAIDEVLRPEFAISVREGFRDSLGLNEPVCHEEFVSFGDREVWGMTTITTLFDAGVPVHVIASFLELDFVQRTEASLSRLKTALKELVDASNDPILLTRDDRVTYANAAARSAGDLDGRPLDAVPNIARIITLPENGKLVILRVK